MSYFCVQYKTRVQLHSFARGDPVFPAPLVVTAAGALSYLLLAPNRAPGSSLRLGSSGSSPYFPQPPGADTPWFIYGIWVVSEMLQSQTALQWVAVYICIFVLSEVCL